METYWGTTHNQGFELESLERRHNSMVLSGRIQAVGRTVTDHDPGGIFGPGNRCSIDNRLGIDVLRDIHLETILPEEEHLISTATHISPRSQYGSTALRTTFPRWREPSVVEQDHAEPMPHC